MSTGMRNEVKLYPKIPTVYAVGVSFSPFPKNFSASFISSGMPKPTPNTIISAMGTTRKWYRNSLSSGSAAYL